MSTKFTRRSFLGSSLGTITVAGCMCGPMEPDSADAGADAGLFSDGGADAGGVDAGGEDAGGEDAAGLDAGVEDASVEDAGVDDAGVVEPEGLADEESGDVFSLGVQSGGALSESVLLWTYSLNAGEENELWIWQEGSSDAVRIDAPSDDDGYVRLELEDLESFTTYRYAFVEVSSSKRSAIGRFKTAPADSASPVISVACATCSNMRTAPWPVLSQMATESPDLLLHMGDMVYADGSGNTQEFRAEWHETLSQQGYRDFLQSSSMLHAWDDHEFNNNIDPVASPQTVTLGREAFYQNSAQRPQNGNLWGSYRWGSTAEFIVLDCRTERIRSTRNGEDATYISQEQFDFLEDRLTNSPCRFKVILNSVPVTRMPDIWISQDDRWQGYAAQRDALLTLLEDDDVANGTLFLSGDFHVGFVGHVQQSGIHRRLIEIAVGPTGNFNPLGNNALRPISLPDEQFEFGTSDLCGTILTFRPESGEVDVRFTNDDGRVLFDGTVRPGQDES